MKLLPHRVIARRFDRADARGGYCVLVVESLVRPGQTREVVVSGHTFESVTHVGQEVMLQQEDA